MLDKKEIIEYVMGEAAKSNVEKRKVGCVIINAKTGQILAAGYNDSEHHAEIRALQELTYVNTTDNSCTLYVSHPPCPDCAKVIAGTASISSVEVVKAFMKFDGDKLRPDLVPPSAIRAMAEVLTFGARKYKPNNWKECDDLSRYYAALGRHLLAHQEGETHDEESGMPHLWHAMTNLAFLIELEENLSKINQ